ncbi:MAG: maltotransferase domain-containing protein [Thermoprotei archaeon]
MSVRAEDVVIQNVRPIVDGGKYPVKRIVGERLNVEVEAFTTGERAVRADLLVKFPQGGEWKRIPMDQKREDWFTASISLDQIGVVEYTVEAWIDDYLTWLKSFSRWLSSGENIDADLNDGINILRRFSQKCAGSDRSIIGETVKLMEVAPRDRVLDIASNPTLLFAIRPYTRAISISVSKYTPTLKVVVDRIVAGFSSWYEMFPRSQTDSINRHGTFNDVERRLEDIAMMGFDVVYFPPIHPIGRTNRRGKNNSPNPTPGDPGSPWAIGSPEGGHKSVHPSLGTLEDFRQLVEKAKSLGLEVAIDLAFQCSPDHPYVRDHPEWFYHRSDGSIRYAENPPKRYYDVYPLNFDCDDWRNLWEELKEVVLFWINMGVRIFRVDNPHTKPFSFWKWLISEIKKQHPDVIFLAEAFTKPNVMYHLAKIGFSQSYTYFTWKNYNWEIEEYFKEISSPPIVDFFRPTLFTNTPDILPFVLQNGGRPAFELRLILAATLSSVYGIYSGYELCENKAVPGKEEYADSEKYEIKPRDWNAPGNIKELVRKVNQIRRENPALQNFRNIRFCYVNNPNLVAYMRWDDAHSNLILIVVNVNPFQEHFATVKTYFTEFGVNTSRDYVVEDLLTGAKYTWRGEENFVKLNPAVQTAHIFRVK